MIKSVKELDKFIRQNLKPNVYYSVHYDTYMTGRVDVLIDFKWWFMIFGCHRSKIKYLEEEINKQRPFGTHISIKSK